MKLEQYESLSIEDKLTARLSDLYFGHYNATREECTLQARKEREEEEMKRNIPKECFCCFKTDMDMSGEYTNNGVFLCDDCIKL